MLHAREARVHTGGAASWGRQTQRWKLTKHNCLVTSDLDFFRCLFTFTPSTFTQISVLSTPRISFFKQACHFGFNAFGVNY